jgi:histidine triad (HIT) family protein
MTIFSRIINGEIPCHKIAETEDFIAFLDVRPMAVGHTLCVPKKEIDYIFDVPDTDLAGLILFSKRVAKALEKAVPCKRIGVTVIGLEVPHAHIHLIPLNTMADISFGKTPLDVPTELMAEIAKRVTQYLT